MICKKKSMKICKKKSMNDMQVIRSKVLQDYSIFSFFDFFSPASPMKGQGQLQSKTLMSGLLIMVLETLKLLLGGFY